jgi:hypothetical protein
MESKTPAKRALAALDIPAPAVDKVLRITDKVRRGIAALASGECKNPTDAARKVGLAPESMLRALAKPHVIQHLQTQTRRRLDILAARAGVVKGDLLDSENAMVADRASSFILGLAGIAPATSPGVALNIEIKAGYVIDLTDDPRRPGADGGMRIISPTVYSPPIDADLDQDSAE